MYLIPGAAFGKRAASSILSTSGSLRGLPVITRARARSRRFSGTLNRKRIAESVMLIVAGPTPFSCRCNWKRRMSSTVAVSGGTPKKRSVAPDLTDVVLPSVRSQPWHQHVFLHALAERCGRGIVLKAGH